MRDNWNAQIDELSRQIQEEEAAFRVPLDDREQKAREMLAAGIKPSASSDVADNPTYGYGFLHPLGYWQYPVYEDEIPESMRTRKVEDV